MAYAKLTFIRNKAVKAFVKQNGKRTSNAYLFALDALVRRTLEKGVKIHNGGCKTLGKDVANYTIS